MLIVLKPLSPCDLTDILLSLERVVFVGFTLSSVELEKNI